MNVFLKTNAKRTFSRLAAHQNVGLFHATESIRIDHTPTRQVQIPAGIELRASGGGLKNARVGVGFDRNGGVYLTADKQRIELGTLNDQTLILGWTITNLRLRGAVRFDNGIVLTVPDREDLPYLLEALALQSSRARFAGFAHQPQARLAA